MYFQKNYIFRFSNLPPNMDGEEHDENILDREEEEEIDQVGPLQFYTENNSIDLFWKIAKNLKTKTKIFVLARKVN